MKYRAFRASRAKAKAKEEEERRREEEEREEEERALKEMEQGGPAASSSAEGKNVKKTQRGDTEETGRDFEWKVSSAFSDLTIIWILKSTTLTFSLRSLE